MSDVESANDPIDARATSAAASLVDSFAGLDVESDLAAVRQGSVVPISSGSPRGRRHWLAAVAAAAVVAIVAGAVAFVVTSEKPSSITDTPDTIEAPTPSTAPTATVAPTPTSSLPATTAPPTTTTSLPPPAPALASVSYLDPPPELPLRQLATISVPIQPDGSYDLAIGDQGIVVSRNLYSYSDANISGRDVSMLDVIGFDGQVRSAAVVVDGGAILAYGPGDVVYMGRQGAGLPIEYSVRAIALSGDRAGAELASDPVDINLFTEYAPMSFGHGADGLIHRRHYLADEPAIVGYRNVDGQPTTLNDAPPTYRFATQEQAGQGLGGTITSSDGTSWTLAVDAAPDRASTYVGASPPAPGANGIGVYVTDIGPNGDPTIDFGIPTMWVVAELHPDGTATWWSVPEGWYVAASDAWGTVLARQNGAQLDIALAEFPSSQTCPNPPEFLPTVLPDGFG